MFKNVWKITVFNVWTFSKTHAWKKIGNFKHAFFILSIAMACKDREDDDIWKDSMTLMALTSFPCHIDKKLHLNGTVNNLRLYAQKWKGDLNLQQLMACCYLKECDEEMVHEYFTSKVRDVVLDIRDKGMSKEAKVIYLAEVLDELQYNQTKYTLEEKQAVYIKYMPLFNQPDDEATQLLRHHISQILGSFQFDMDETEKSEPLQDSCNGSDLSDVYPELISHDHDPDPHL